MALPHPHRPARTLGDPGAVPAATPQYADPVYSFALETVTGPSVWVVGVNAAGDTFAENTYDLSCVRRKRPGRSTPPRGASTRTRASASRPPGCRGRTPSPR